MTTYATFTWRSHSTLSGGGEFKKHTAQFGEGYKQETGDAINNELQNWTVVVGGTEAEMQEVVDFLRTHAGVTPFNWKPPFSASALLFKCAKWTPTDQGGGVWTLSLQFEQDYQP